MRPTIPLIYSKNIIQSGHIKRKHKTERNKVDQRANYELMDVKGSAEPHHQ